MLGKVCFNRFQWLLLAEHAICPMNFLFANIHQRKSLLCRGTWTELKTIRGAQTPISNLYLCLREKGQNEFHKRSLFVFSQLPFDGDANYIMDGSCSKSRRTLATRCRVSEVKDIITKVGLIFKKPNYR